ncbi:hypothetical protein L6164_023789 [Bauhinia variegata]|uniref:Uncharacterized protein n=1 Tax=Bauhinia variegata TaxID=167791 RepID=A0ACB9MJF8_BAUVA|nr:hypothetical protein L6164_023789 [Bauhinia variegata]
MALYQLCLIPNLGFSKIIQIGEAQSSSLFKAKCCNHVHRPIQCKAFTVSNQANPCRYADFGPSVWDYDFIQSLTSEFLDNELYAQQRNELKEEVRTMLCTMKNPLYQLELIDDLQRLGVAYHFKNEINNILNHVYKNVDSLMEEKNLYFTALKFRLLRENVYLISAGTDFTALGEKLGFARDKIVENFVWTVAFSFLPHFGHLRRVLTKVNALITTIYDIYDVYGTLEELELFTDVVSRWDINAIDTLPEYMKICFLELYNFVDEFARDILKEKGHQILSYLAKVWADLCKAYLTEAKWHFSGYAPSLEVYIDTAWISIGATVILIHCYFSTPNPIRMEDLKYLEEYSNIIRTSSKTFRLVNDLGTQRREIEDGDIIKSIQCYMHDTGASEQFAREHIKAMICATWKKMNEDVYYSPFPPSFTEIALNMIRTSLRMYQHGDAHSIQDTKSTKWKSSLLFDAIPIP